MRCIAGTGTRHGRSRRDDVGRSAGEGLGGERRTSEPLDAADGLRSRAAGGTRAAVRAARAPPLERHVHHSSDDIALLAHRCETARPVPRRLQYALSSRQLQSAPLCHLLRLLVRPLTVVAAAL